MDEPRKIVRRFNDDGAKMVALRMGAAGSLVARQREAIISVQAIPVKKIVDVTGAGNGYCGGLVVGMAETGDPVEAAQYAAVSASLALEQFGAMIPVEGLRDRAAFRLDRYAGIRI